MEIILRARAPDQLGLHSMHREKTFSSPPCQTRSGAQTASDIIGKKGLHFYGISGQAGSRSPFTPR
jgi:hypothetical protein